MSPLLAQVAPPRAVTESQPPPQPRPRPSAPTLTARAVLAGYARTLLVPLIGLVCLLAGWLLTAASGWPAAAATVTAWAVGSAAWLYRRGWSAAAVHRVTWMVPALVLTVTAVPGWLTADGLVLWAPVTTLLAAALTLTDQPLPVAGQRPRRR
jgi:hypothetical protein